MDPAYAAKAGGGGGIPKLNWPEEEENAVGEEEDDLYT